MLRAAFGEKGKLDELEMMFDGIAVHQQLQKAVGVRIEHNESAWFAVRCCWFFRAGAWLVHKTETGGKEGREGAARWAKVDWQ